MLHHTMKRSCAGWLFQRLFVSSLNQGRRLNSFPSDFRGNAVNKEQQAKHSMAPARQSDPEALRNYRNHETRNRRGAQSFVTSHNLIIDDGGEEEEEEEPGRRSGQEVARYPRYAGPRRTHLDKMFSTVDRSQYTEQQLKFMLDQAQARATDNARMIPFQGWLGPEPSTSTIGQQRSTSECLKGFATKPEEQSKSVLDDCTFDATFWDRVLTSPNPTRELREIARASLQQRRDGEPAHPHLWWLEQMIRIKYCDPFDEKKDEDKLDFLTRSKVLINHVFQVVKQAPCRPRVRWAALLHDVGKPDTVSLCMEEEKLQFRDHEMVGSLMVDRILEGYGYPPDFRKEVATLVARSGRIRQVEQINDNAARRLFSSMGPLFEDFIDLYLADCTTLSVKRQIEHIARAHFLLRNVRRKLQEDRIAALKCPLNGHDVMQITGLQPGMHLGAILTELRNDYLARGPYSTAEAKAVVERLYKDVSKKTEKMLRKEKKEAKLKKGTAETPEGDLIKVKSPNFLPLARECDLGHPVYVFRLRILHVQQSGETTESLAEEPSYLNRELFRDIAVQESAGIFEFAQIISHAFDFDFDDDFTFYRRKNTSRCPGSYSVLLLLPSVMSGAGAEAAARCVEEGTRKPGDTAPGSNEFCIDPTRFEEDFDPVIHVSGQITKDMNSHLKIINYGRIPGCLLSDEELDELEWAKSNEVAMDEEVILNNADQEMMLNSQQLSLSYPLRVPHKGSADLATTLVLHLFDRSRRTIVLELRQGGPWYIRVDFVEVRKPKEYEITIPRTIASLGQAPRQYKYYS